MSSEPRAAHDVGCEQELEWSRAALLHAPSGICVTALDGRILSANAAFSRLLGRDAPALRGASLADLVDPDDATLVRERLTAAAEGNGAGAAFDLRFPQAGEGTAWVLVSVHAVAGAEGPRALVVHAEDVTERRLVRDLLHEHEEKFRIAFENAPTGMSIVRPDGTYASVNQALCDMFGYTREELLAGSIYEVTHPEDVERSAAWFRKVAAGDQSEPSLEKRYLHRDGHVVWAVVRARWVREADATPRFSVVHVQDVTERKRGEEERQRLQAELGRAQKIEAIGHLAGGIAHDFNNLLTAIGANATLALEEPELADGLRVALDEISQAVGSGAEMARKLLAFSRRQVIAPRVLDLNEVVTGLRRLLQRMLGEDLSLAISLAPDLGRVRFDPGQVDQILLNLAVNARDAMWEGGKLTVETANLRVDEEYAHAHPGLTPGQYVVLAVSDDGCGMTDETRAHLFEPFYTTKSPGKGTGLGLAMIYGAVKQNGGAIEVDSAPGHGTTIRIYIPRVYVPAEPRRAPAAPTARGGSEKLMLVEDDPAVRAPAVRLLQHLGFTVYPFSCAQEALASEPTLPPLDLLVTDVIMPGMNGGQLAEQLAARRPGLRVLFTSGYMPDAVAREGVLEGAIEFLAKPYALETLARRVREVLDGPAGDAGGEGEAPAGGD